MVRITGNLKSKRGYIIQHLLGAGVLGDGLGALGHGVLGQLPGQQEAHGGLDLPGGDGGPGGEGQGVASEAPEIPTSCCNGPACWPRRRSSRRGR